MSGNTTRSWDGGNAVRDELTATFSRGYFLDAIDIERQLALESGRPFAVCLLDIDQLGNVNDEFGLAAGDAVIAGVADTVRQTLDRPQWQNLRCLLARFDGDSLILLLPGCRGQRAEQFAHVLRRSIADCIYSGTVAVTASLAVASYTMGESIDELVGRLERTMHLAKQFGGDAVESVRTREPRRRTATVIRLPVEFRQAPESSTS